MGERRVRTAEEQVDFAVAKLPDDVMMEVRARDLMFVYQTLGELIRFFHQPMHWTTLDHVEQFIGNRHRGAFHLLCACYYEKLRNVWPPEIAAALEAGELDAD